MPPGADEIIYVASDDDEESSEEYKTKYMVKTALVRSVDYPQGHPLGGGAPTLSSDVQVAELVRECKINRNHAVTVAVNKLNRLVGIHESNAESDDAFIREIVKVALLTSAHGVFVVRYEPAVSTEPNSNEIAVMVTARNILFCLGVQFIDHIVINDEGSTSFKRKGLL